MPYDQPGLNPLVKGTNYVTYQPKVNPLVMHTHYETLGESCSTANIYDPSRQSIPDQFLRWSIPQLAVEVVPIRSPHVVLFDTQPAKTELSTAIVAPGRSVRSYVTKKKVEIKKR